MYLSVVPVSRDFSSSCLSLFVFLFSWWRTRCDEWPSESDDTLSAHLDEEDSEMIEGDTQPVNPSLGDNKSPQQANDASMNECTSGKAESLSM